MAFISKSEVQEKSKKLKALNTKYGVSARFSGSNTSTLTLNISKGKIDFMKNYFDTTEVNNISTDLDNQTQYMQVSPWHLTDRFSTEALEYLKAAFAIMHEGWFDESDIMTDYFHTAWYNYICIGKWNKPYITI